MAIKTPDGSPVYPLEYHFNEDPHSVPDPIAGKKYMTATQAKYINKETWDTDTEVKTINPQFYTDFNKGIPQPQPSDSWMVKYWGKEPLAVQLRNKEESDSDSDSSSDSSDSDSDDDKPENKKTEEKKPEDKKNVQWMVTPDLGELDDHSTLYREWDNPEYLGAMKPKFSGWTNPLSWTDDGHDDDQVLVLMTANGIVERRVPDSELVGFEDSEGPTKVDFGENDDHSTLYREWDNPEYLAEMKPKFSGWTNPLSWTDNGNDDGSILLRKEEYPNWEIE